MTVPTGTTRINLVFRWVAEPRHLSALAASSYTVFGVAGVCALFLPAGWYEATGVAVSPVHWALLLIPGAVLGVSGALPGWWWCERAGIVLCGSGLLAWQAALLLTRAGADAPAAVAFRFLLGLACQIMLTTRYVRITGAYKDPHRR